MCSAVRADHGTYKADEDAEELDDVGKDDGVEPADDGVEDGDTGRDDDGGRLVDAQDHTQGGTWRQHRHHSLLDG